MTKQKTLWGLAALLAVSLVSGCKNNNLFGDLHEEGSGDAESLVADANAALANREYDKANSYFERALAQDSRNSDALYGQAAAAMGLSGLDVGQLVANLTTSGGGAGFSGALAQSNIRPISSQAIDPTSLLYQIDIPSLDSALVTVIKNLEKIRMGFGDGSVDPDNASLLINLGVARLLKAVTVPLRKGILDVRLESGSYEVHVIQLTSDECPDVKKSVDNITFGYLNLSRAASKLNLVSGTVLNDIEQDLDALYAKFYTEVNGTCLSIPATRPNVGPSSDSDGL